MSVQKKKKDGGFVWIQNCCVWYEYYILEIVEVGISFLGIEVKLVWVGKVQLCDSYVDFVWGEVFFVVVYISFYLYGNCENYDLECWWKFLFYCCEIEKFYGWVQQKGFVMVLLLMYVSGNWIKVELVLVQGKKLYDKRVLEWEWEMQCEVVEILNCKDWQSVEDWWCGLVLLVSYLLELVV